MHTETVFDIIYGLAIEFARDFRSINRHFVAIQVGSSPSHTITTTQKQQQFDASFTMSTDVSILANEAIVLCNFINSLIASNHHNDSQQRVEDIKESGKRTKHGKPIAQRRCRCRCCRRRRR